jgi:hypothetical protein
MNKRLKAVFIAFAICLIIFFAVSKAFKIPIEEYALMHLGIIFVLVLVFATDTILRRRKMNR